MKQLVQVYREPSFLHPFTSTWILFICLFVLICTNTTHHLGVSSFSAFVHRLHMKYKGMFLLDKNPDDEDEDLPEEKWEHRVITNLSWENRKGWNVATKLLDDEDVIELID